MKKSKVYPISSDMSGGECCVSGVLAWTFRVSQLCGVAPVKFAKRRGEQVISVSRALYIVDCFVMTMLNVLFIVDMFYSFIGNQGLPIHSIISDILLTVDFVLVLLIATVGAYGGLNRMRMTMDCISRVQKINKDVYGLETKTSTSRDIRKSAFFHGYLCFAVLVTLAEYGRFISERHNKILSSFLFCISSLHVAYIMTFLLVYQFAYTALEVLGVLRGLNDVIEQLTVPGSLTVKSMTHLTVQRLTSRFAVVCDVIRCLGEAYGFGLALLLFSCLMHLVIAPLRLIDSFYTKEVPVTILVLETSWCLMRIIFAMIIVEPPHMTLFEIERTRLLVNKLSVQTTEVLVKKEVNKFSKYLLLNTIEYSPLGICSINRSLMVSICGSIVTYLVIVVQFRGYE